jgi:uncharacterized lipoprotein YajG
MMISDCGLRSSDYKKNVDRIGRFFASAFFVLLMLSGCAEKGPILLTVGYQEPAETAKAPSKLTVAVSPFKDVRDKAPSVLGKKTIPSGRENDLVVQGTVAEIVTSGLKKALASRGIAVKDVPPWDLSAEGMKADGAALVLGGEIKTLWLESTAVPLKTHLQASVQIKVVAGDPSEKKIIRSVEVSSRLEQDVLYSREKLEDALSEALSSVIDQIFKDDDLKKRLQ